MAFFDKLRNLWPFGHALIPRDPISYRAIGLVRNRVREHRTAGWEDVRSDLLLRPELAAALTGIEGFSHVIVAFHAHRISDDGRHRLTLPISDEIAGEIGVLATRVPARPNPLCFAVVPVVWRRKNVLRVRGLDALDGSPILDIKPYLPPYDAVDDATVPEWAAAAMRRAQSFE